LLIDCNIRDCDVTHGSALPGSRDFTLLRLSGFGGVEFDDAHGSGKVRKATRKNVGRMTAKQEGIMSELRYLSGWRLSLVRGAMFNQCPQRNRRRNAWWGEKWRGA
jgi:hypothetical protein